VSGKARKYKGLRGIGELGRKIVGKV